MVDFADKLAGWVSQRKEKQKSPDLSFEWDKRSEPYRPLVEAAEQKYGLPKNLYARMLNQESRFDPKAVSPAGAEGIAQIMRKHHPGVDPYNVEQAIDYGAKYTRENIDRFQGDIGKGVAAYNAGPTRIANAKDQSQWPKETQDYYQKILGQQEVPAAQAKKSSLGDIVAIHDAYRKATKEASGTLGALSSGAKRTFSGVRTAANVLAGDDEDVKRLSQEAGWIPQTPEQKAFQQAVAKRTEEHGDDSIWQGIKNIAGAVWEQPKGAWHEMAGQLPNSAVVMGSAATGAKIGATLGGPVGAIAGGVLGLIAGNIGIETGFIAQEQGKEYDRETALRQGVTKGGVISGIDVATMGLTATMFKAARGAAMRVLKNAGVDVTSDAAITAALKANPDLMVAVKKAGGQSALRYAPKGVRGAMIKSGALGLESVGEGAGEYLGSAAAGLDASFTEAVMEAAMSIPQSAAEVGVGQFIAKRTDKKIEQRDAQIKEAIKKTENIETLNEFKASEQGKTYQQEVDQKIAEVQAKPVGQKIQEFEQAFEAEPFGDGPDAISKDILDDIGQGKTIEAETPDVEQEAKPEIAYEDYKRAYTNALVNADMDEEANQVLVKLSTDYPEMAQKVEQELAGEEVSVQEPTETPKGEGKARYFDDEGILPGDQMVDESELENIPEGDPFGLRGGQRTAPTRTSPKTQVASPETTTEARTEETPTPTMGEEKAEKIEGKKTPGKNPWEMSFDEFLETHNPPGENFSYKNQIDRLNKMDKGERFTPGKLSSEDFKNKLIAQARTHHGKGFVEYALITGKLTTEQAEKLGHFKAYPDLKEISLSKRPESKKQPDLTLTDKTQKEITDEQQMQERQAEEKGQFSAERAEYYKDVTIGKKELDFKKTDKTGHDTTYRYSPFKFQGVEYLAVEVNDPGVKGSSYEVRSPTGTPVLSYTKNGKQLSLSGINAKNLKEFKNRVETVLGDGDVNLLDDFHYEKVGFSEPPPSVAPATPDVAEGKEPYRVSKASFLEENSLGGSEVFNQWKTATGRSGKTARDKNDLAAYRNRLDVEIEQKHESAVKQALKSGDLTPAEYKEIHEKDYGPIEKFAPTLAEPATVEKPLTKKEKSQKEYTDLVSSLTDEQKEQVKHLIPKEMPDMPGMQALKIRDTLRYNKKIEDSKKEEEATQKKQDEIGDRIKQYSTHFQEVDRETGESRLGIQWRKKVNEWIAGKGDVPNRILEKKPVSGKQAERPATLTVAQKKAQRLADKNKAPVAFVVFNNEKGIPMGGAYVEMPLDFGKKDGDKVLPEQVFNGEFRDSNGTLIELSSNYIVAYPKEKPKILAERKAEMGKELPQDITIAAEGKDKVVGANLSPKEEKTISPQEQKKYLLDEIEVAIKAAKTDKSLNQSSAYSPTKEDYAESYEENKAAFGTVTISVPGDGEFTIINHPETLNAFYEKAKKFMPVKIAAPFNSRIPAAKPSQKRLVAKDVEYYNPFVARKEGVIDEKGRKKFYADGLYSDAAYLIKTEKPKIKGEYEAKSPNLQLTLDSINKEQKTQAKIVGELSDGKGVEEKGKFILNDPVAHIVSTDGKKHSLFNAKYIDSIMTKYPKSEVSLTESGAALFADKGSPVAAVMPLNKWWEDMDFAKKRYQEITGEKITELTTETPTTESEIAQEPIPAQSKEATAQEPKPEAKEEGKIEGKEELTLVKASPEDLPFETAMRAHSGTSFVPEKRAKSEQESYYQHIKSIHDEILKEITPGQHEQAKQELSQYKDKYLEKYTALLQGQSGIVSPMIAGPSKFPFDRMEKRNEADRKRTEAFYEWREKAVRGMKKRLGLIGGTAISSDDATAIDQLKAKIEKAEAEHEKMLGINKIIKNKKLTDAEKIQQVQSQFGFKEETAKKLLDPSMIGGKGFATFELTNNRANIKRMKDRVAQLERERSETTIEIEVGNITIKDNVEDNRVQIFYPGKPDEATRKQLKSRGFKWSPSVGAWQRMRSRDAMYYAKDIVGYKEPDAKFSRKFKPVDVESKDRIDEIVQKFKDHSGYDRWADDTGDYPSDVIGIRAVHNDVEIGDILPVSYELTMEDWDQMTPEELEPYKLGGTSSFLIPVNDFLKDPSQAIRTATEKATKYGNKTVLIYGINWGTVDSSDKGEVLIKDAEVIDIFGPEDIGVMANNLLPKFSRKPEETGTIANASELQQSVDTIMSKFPGIDKGMVQVHQSEKDLPKALQDEIKRQKSEGQFYAVYYDNGIYLVADNLQRGDVSELAIVEGFMRHEGRHWAIEQIFPSAKAREQFFKSAAFRYRNEVVDYLKKSKMATNQENLAIAAEEVIVDKFLAGEKGTLIDRFLAKVSEWLRKLFPNLQVTTAEIRELIRRADRIIEGKEAVGLGSPQMAMASRIDKAPVWYSQLEKTLESKLPGTGSPKQIKQLVDSWQKKGEFKADELDWVGLNDWLDKKEWKVTKQEILDFVRANNVEIQEITKGGREKPESLEILEDGGRFYVLDGDRELGDPQGYATEEEADRAADEIEDNWEEPEGGGTKFSQYQMEGEKENYREVLLTMPGKKSYEVKKVITEGGGTDLFGEEIKHSVGYAIFVDGKKISTTYDSKESAEIAAKKMHSFNTALYSSSHFPDTPNILVHVRMNDRTGPNGEKILFIEEVQSDAAQDKRRGKNVSDMPFIDKTGSWVMVAIKRMVRYAAENGYDSIAWTPGEVQAERYDLSKQIDEIRYRNKGNGKYYVAAIRGDESLFDQDIEDAKLDDTFGKEVADKIRSGVSAPGVGVGLKVLKGLDLKVGGEGMKGFYDKILPAEVNKFFNKKMWGVAKVGVAELNIAEDKTGYRVKYPDGSFGSMRFTDKVKAQAVATARGGEVVPFGNMQEVWTLPITPEMRQKALREGMPMFQRKEPRFLRKDQLSGYAESLGAKSPMLQKGLDEIASTWEAIKNFKVIPGGFIDQLLTTAEWSQHPIEKKVVAARRDWDVDKAKIYHDQDYSETYDVSAFQKFKEIKERGRKVLDKIRGRELYDVDSANVSPEYKEASRHIDQMDTERKYWNDVAEDQLADPKVRETDKYFTLEFADRKLFKKDGFGKEKTFQSMPFRYTAKGQGVSFVTGMIDGEEKLRTIKFNKETFKDQATVNQWFKDNKSRLEGGKGLRSELAEKGVSEDVLSFIDMFRETQDKNLELQMKSVKEILDAYKDAGKDIPALYHEKDEFGKPRAVTLLDAYREMGSHKGYYAPRMRENGEWIVLTEKDGEQYRWHKDSQKAAIKLSRQLARDGHKIHKRFRDDKKIPESIYQDLTLGEVAKALETAVNQMQDVDVDLKTKFRMEVIQAASDMMKARGFRQRKISRKEGPVVKGYIVDPLTRHVLSTYQLAGGIAKGKAANKMIEAFLGKKEVYKRDSENQQWVIKNEKGDIVKKHPMTVEDIAGNAKTKSFFEGGLDPAKEKEMHDKLKNYISNQLRNPDKYDRMVGLGKSIVSFRYLGFGIRPAVVNMTAMLQTAPTAIHQYAMGGKGKLRDVGKAIFRAGKDYAGIMRGKKLINANEQALMEHIQENGYDAPQYMRDALGSIHDMYGGAWSNIMEVAMKLFGITEQWNRGSTALAAYRMAIKSGANHETAIELAVDSTEKAHGIYSRATDPSWAQGGNPAALVFRMGYTYQKFAHNYMQMLYDVGFRKKNIKAAVFAMAAPLVMGGLKSSVAASVAFFAVKALMGALGLGDDPEKFVYDTIRKELGHYPEQIARYGTFGAMGFEVSGSLAIGMEVPKTLIDLTGPFGGLYKDISQSFWFLSTGQPYRAAEKVLPRAAENVMAGIREARNMPVTMRGFPLFDEEGRLYEPSIGETAWKVAGFRGARRATVQERDWEAKKVEQKYSSKRDKIYQRYRAYLTKTDKDPSEYKKIMADVNAYNKMIVDRKMTGLIPFITAQQLRQQVRRTTQPTKRELMRRREPE